MTAIAEIKAAIEKLPKAQVEELAAWLDVILYGRTTPPAVDRWLQHACGAALTGTPAAATALTRGDE